MYSTDFSGEYPDSLSKLTPDYLRLIPECPMDGESGYSYEKRPEPVYYLLRCTHDHSKVGLGKGFPAYSGQTGIVENEEELGTATSP